MKKTHTHFIYDTWHTYIQNCYAQYKVHTGIWLLTYLLTSILT